MQPAEKEKTVEITNLGFVRDLPKIMSKHFKRSFNMIIKYLLYEVNL